MRSTRLLRRTLLGSGTAVAGVGLLGPGARGQAASPASALARFQPTVSMLAERSIAKLPATSALLTKLDVSPSLFGVLTDVVSATVAGGGLKHNALVRRLRNPATLKIPTNPNFVPQGRGFTAVEQRLFNPRPAQGKSL